MKKPTDTIDKMERMRSINDKEKVEFLYKFYSGIKPTELAKEYQCSIGTVNDCIVFFSKMNNIMDGVRKMKRNKELEKERF